MAKKDSKFRVDSFGPLKALPERQVCPNCGKRRMYFCYDCIRYADGVGDVAPKVHLPYKIDIIKHQGEKNSKSTAIHCKLLAPESTSLYRSIANLPDDYHTSGENIVLVYPDALAMSITEFVAKRGPIDRFVFLDATWYTVGGLRLLPQIKHLPSVKLQGHETDYWRPQKGHSREHLSTVEAVYFAVRENHESAQCCSGGNEGAYTYGGEFDNLLYWFYFFREMVPEEKRIRYEAPVDTEQSMFPK